MYCRFVSRSLWRYAPCIVGLCLDLCAGVLCEPAFYLCFGDLPVHLVWSNCECAIRPEVTRCR